MSSRKLLQLLVLPALLFFSQISFAQDRVITGRVTDSTGTGVAGITVTAKGSTKATQTIADGSFSISVPSSVSTLIFSSVGFATQEVSVSGSTPIRVTMTGATSSLNEVVVIGYGSRLKKDLTGSLTNITSKDFNRGTITTPEQLIAGKVAGVQITSNGGAPGSGSTIRIRGGASLNASNDPLIVIDGVPVSNGGIAGVANPLAMINPNDIESITILKDAASTAIYGSRASNGVILVVTKKGKAGKPKFNFNTQYSLSTLPKHADVLTGDEMRAYVASHGTPQQIALLGSANTDWQDEIYKNAGTTDNNISMSGTFKNMPYRFSLGYLNQDGILKTGNLTRKTGSISLIPRFFHDYLKIDLNLKGTVSNSRFADEGAIGNAVRFDPTKFVRASSKRYGGYFEWLDPSSQTGLRDLAPINPVGLLDQKLDLGETKRSIGNVQIDYKLHFFPDLRVNVNLGYDVSKGTGTIYINDSAAASYKRSPDGLHGGVDNQYRQTRSNELLETYVNYTKDISSIDSRIDAIVGYSYQFFSVKNINFPDNTVDGTVISTPVFPFDKQENSLISQYARVIYTFKNKYILQGSVRRDGSSRFSEDNRWGWFPAAAFAWRMKEEDFLKNSNVLSELKLRLSFGITGQQDGIANYDYIPRYSLSNNQAQYQLGSAFYAMYRPAGYNPNLKWEQTATYNVGFDYGLWNNRITGTLDIYLKKTSDLLSIIDQPAGTNFSNKILANIGEVENRGVEFTINGTAVKTRNLTVDAGFNITYNKNEVTKLTIVNDPTFPGNLVGGIAGGVGSTIQVNSVGYPKSSFYVYQQVYDADGKPIENLFEDRDRDGQITINDLYRYKSPDPTVFLGAYSNVTWKRWSGGFVLRANIGNYMYNNRFSNTGVMRNLIDPLGYIANGSRNVLETDFTGNGDKYFLSDYYMENASFLRMDNIYIGFDAGDFVRKNTNLRISANVQNVFTVTKYRGLDPEVSGGIDNNFYPRPRIFALVLNLDF